MKSSDGSGSMLNNSSSSNNNLVRGVVAANKDPLNIGRVKVRIYKFHGTKDDGLSDESLPWAFPSFPYASYDAGSFTIPEVNSNVWILFEDGNIRRPVYLGSFYGIGSTNTKLLSYDEGNIRHQPAYQQEIPKEYSDPNKRVVYKSPKGSMIIIDESDGNESISISTESGTPIKLISGETELEIVGNKMKFNGVIESEDLVTESGSFNRLITDYEDHCHKYSKLTSRDDIGFTSTPKDEGG